MKTNLLKVTAYIRVPEHWDAETCLKLRGLEVDGELKGGGAVDALVSDCLSRLSSGLKDIHEDIELHTEVQR